MVHSHYPDTSSLFLAPVQLHWSRRWLSMLDKSKKIYCFLPPALPLQASSPFNRIFRAQNLFQTTCSDKYIFQLRQIHIAICTNTAAPRCHSTQFSFQQNIPRHKTCSKLLIRTNTFFQLRQIHIAICTNTAARPPLQASSPFNRIFRDPKPVPNYLFGQIHFFN